MKRNYGQHAEEKKVGHRIFIFKPNGKGRKHLFIGVSAAIPVPKLAVEFG